MKISLLDFIEGKEKKIEINKKLDKSFTIEDVDLIKPIQVTLELYKVEDDIGGTIKIKYEYTEQCSRCLKKYPNIIEQKEDVILSSQPIEEEQKDSDYFYIEIKNETIDIENVIKEIFNINRPLKPLCDIKCEGLCPKCGANLNIEKCNCKNEKTDPRMNKLKKLLDKEV